MLLHFPVCSLNQDGGLNFTHFLAFGRFLTAWLAKAIFDICVSVLGPSRFRTLFWSTSATCSRSCWHMSRSKCTRIGFLLPRLNFCCRTGSCLGLVIFRRQGFLRRPSDSNRTSVFNISFFSSRCSPLSSSLWPTLRCNSTRHGR